MKRIHWLTMYVRRFLQAITVTTLVFMGLGASPVFAQNANSLSGASNAADYQPPTGNPQSGVGSVSQSPAGPSNLQPQQSLNQTALPSLTDLRVSGVAGEPNTNTTTTEVASEPQSKTGPRLVMLVSAVAVIGAGYVLLKSRKPKVAKSSVVTKVSNEPKGTTVVEAPTPIEAKSTEVKKKTGKPKKSKGSKRSRRKR